jgi:hypothetical protein
VTTQDRLPYRPSEVEPGEVTSDLESDLATLYARERRAYPNPLAKKERVWSRLERSLNLGPGDPDGGGGGAVAASASSSRSTPTVKRLMGALSMSASVLVGASLLWSFASEGSAARTVASPEPLASPVASRDVSSQASSDSPVETTAGVRGIPVEALPSVHASVEPIERANPGRKIARAVSCTICEERAVLEVGRRGLREKNGTLALAAIDEHQSRFPTGQLAEERESLRVHVLFALGRVDEAEARKSAFIRLYPRSPLLESVKRAGTR